MIYPQLVPTQRSFDPGDFPVKAFRAQNGAEVRYLYGNKRVGMAMSLTYANIPDADAEAFIAHFHAMQGTYQQFQLNEPALTSGWAGSASWLGPEHYGSRWRYKEAPRVQAVYPGISTVQVELVAATV